MSEVDDDFAEARKFFSDPDAFRKRFDGEPRIALGGSLADIEPLIHSPEFLSDLNLMDDPRIQAIRNSMIAKLPKNTP